MKTIVIPNGILTLSDTEATCPNCKNEIKYKEKDLYNKDFLYKICKSCKKKVGISTDMRGDIVTWLKETENQEP